MAAHAQVSRRGSDLLRGARRRRTAIKPDRVRTVAPIEVEANGAVVLEIGLAAN
jgi:hypothetical protein